MTITQISALKKTPFFPVCVEGDRDITDSKFSGIPWLSAGESWPRCQNCEKEMQLFVQLNLSELPSPCEIDSVGLLQLFYCTNTTPQCEVDCGSWFWNDKAMLVRIVLPHGSANSPVISPVIDAMPARTIRRWEPGDAELPRVEELLSYVELSDEDADVLYEQESNEAYAGPEGGDKLGGWPLWIQSVEYPECRICKKAMRLIFQIDSQVNLPYMWGDSGCAHITQCAEHKDVVSFGWACF